MERAPLTAARALPSRAIGTGPWPRVTLACISVLLVAQFVPGLAEALLFDRDAVRQGQLWRLVTAHWVHYSWAHLWGNVAVLAVAGAWAESRGVRELVSVLGLASLLVGGAVWMFEPGIPQFAGASGVAIAVTVYAAGRTLRNEGRARWLAGLVLAGMAAKLLAEIAGGHWRDTAADGFVTVTTSHISGALTGAVLAVALAPRRARRPGCSASP